MEQLMFDDPSDHLNSTRVSYRVGFYAAILTSAVTAVTFGLALTAIPISGAFCPQACIEYPYLDTISQFPKDYLWMFPAILLLLLYLILMVSIHQTAAPRTKVFSQIGMAFAVIATTVLVSDYFIQLSVVPASLSSGETEGIPLITQYNPHGLFIALEDLGYLMMSISFLFVAFAFSRNTRLESVVRWVFLISSVLAAVSLVLVLVTYGVDRKDRLEVALISIDWLTLLISGILLAIVFKRRLRAAEGFGPGRETAGS
jgi:hypothetical protein